MEEPSAVAQSPKLKGTWPGFRPEHSLEPMRSRQVDGASRLGGGAPSH